jgi:hypothetical protein
MRRNPKTESTPSQVLPGDVYGVGTRGKSSELAESIDFSQTGFCMTFRMTDAQKGHSWFFYSYDRGKTWKGPFDFPMMGQKAVMARTDYVVNGKRDAMVFLTAAKAAGGEGRTFMARTKDGGLHWEFVAWTAPDPGVGFTIMPSTVRLSKSDLVTTVRHEDSLRKGPNWIDAYASRDDGKAGNLEPLRPPPETTAESAEQPVADARLAITYAIAPHRSKYGAGSARTEVARRAGKSCSAAMAERGTSDIRVLCNGRTANL